MFRELDKGISQSLVDGVENIVTPFGKLASNIFEGSPERKFIALTAFDQSNIPVGFCDFRFFGDTKSAKLQAPISRYQPSVDFPGVELRDQSGDDGLYVAEEARGKEIGTTLLLSAIQLAKSYGAKIFVVGQGDKQAEWYTKLGEKEVLGGFAFDL